MKIGIDAIKDYRPRDKKEEITKEKMLELASTNSNMFSRECLEGHMTSSGFVINKEHTKVLMAFHSIYQSYAWTGGHNDGNENWLEVAHKEVLEETGLLQARCISSLIAIDDLPVDAHKKRGKEVQAHRHYNVTYVFEADENDKIRSKPDENSALKWIPFNELDQWVSEKKMISVYNKIIKRIQNI